MNKQEFLTQLSKGLSGLPQEDREERISFYSEMIDDRIEDGLSEEEAVAAIGSVDDIARTILAETPVVPQPAKQRRRLRWWEITLLVLGSPLWVSLLIAAAAAAVGCLVAIPNVRSPKSRRKED